MSRQSSDQFANLRCVIRCANHQVPSFPSRYLNLPHVPSGIILVIDIQPNVEHCTQRQTRSPSKHSSPILDQRRSLTSTPCAFTICEPWGTFGMPFQWQNVLRLAAWVDHISGCSRPCCTRQRCTDCNRKWRCADKCSSIHLSVVGEANSPKLS